MGVSIGAGISGPLVLVLSQLEPGSSDPTEAARVQRMAQAVLFAAGFCVASALYLPPNKFGSEYGGKNNKALIVSMGDFAGYLAITLFNFVLSRLLSSGLGRRYGDERRDARSEFGRHGVS